MTTTTAKAARHTPVPVTLAGKPVYATATGLKLTARGKVLPAGALLAALPKGDARKVRKALRSAGKGGLAGAACRRSDPAAYPTYDMDGSRYSPAPTAAEEELDRHGWFDDRWPGAAFTADYYPAPRRRRGGRGL